MKSMLALVLSLAVAGIVTAQDLSRPLPSVIQSSLPAGAPAPAMVSHSTNWNVCTVPTACPTLCPASTAGCWASRGTACERLRNWLTFRVCEPNHSCVPHPYHAPLREYFPKTRAPLGFDGPLDCNSCSAARPRIMGWTPQSGSPSCAGSSSCPSTPLAYAQPIRACDVPCATMQRKYFFQRLVSFFRIDRCGLARSPMSCQIGGTCSVGGSFNYHYAGNQPAMIYYGVPATAPVAATPNPVSAMRPFTNP